MFLPMISVLMLSEKPLLTSKFLNLCDKLRVFNKHKLISTVTP